MLVVEGVICEARSRRFDSVEAHHAGLIVNAVRFVGCYLPNHA
jgi:hypothetical protein